MSEQSALLNYTIRLENQLENQKKALHHWREKADLDYVRIQRMYQVLTKTLRFMETANHPSLRLEIQEVIAGIDHALPALPENFK